MKTSRREFLKASGILVGGALLAGSVRDAYALPNGRPIGFQTFEIFPDLTKDWQGTWNKMAGMGYKFPDLDYFGPIAQRTPKEINQTLARAGLYCTICHFLPDDLGIPTFKGTRFGGRMKILTFDQTMETAHTIKGVKTVVCTAAGGRAAGMGGKKVTIDDWKSLADQLNEVGVKVKKAGFKLGYHNHYKEFVPINGKVPYDVLMESTDPKLVHFQIDVGNLTFGGGNAYHYLAAYPNRYLGIHVKDFKPGWAAVPVGSGILDWKRIFALAKKDHITNYVAEVGAYGALSISGKRLKQSPMSVLELFRRSAEYLEAFKS